jgi:hypothetical protein
MIAKGYGFAEFSVEQKRATESGLSGLPPKLKNRFRRVMVYR